MKKLATKKMKTGGMNNPNATATVNKTPTKYTGGMNAAATVNKTPTKYTGGKSTAPAGAVPAAKYGKMMKKGGMVKSKKK
jgi:hypothetical protein